MLAELAAANAAFAVIKQCVSNGRDLASAGKAIGDFVFAKEELTRRANNRKKPGKGNADLEEFMALEKIREQEQHLKEVMIWSGRPGMWDDWQRFQAEARKSRRVQEQLAKKRRNEIINMIGIILASALLVGGIVGLIWWVMFLKAAQ
jgi:hypothetical protein